MHLALTRARLVVAMLVLVTPTAAALAAPPRSPAEKLMDDGTRLFNAGSFGEALASFEAARALAPEAAGPLRAIGMTLAKMERCAEALGPLGEFLGRKTAGPDVAEARAARDRCRSVLLDRTRLTVTCNVPGAVVRLDDPRTPVTATAPVEKLKLEPGTHTVHVEAAGWVTATARVEAKLGSAVEIHVDLARAPASPAEARSSGDTAATAAALSPGVAAGPPAARSRTWPWLVAAGGAALVVTTILVIVVVTAGPNRPDQELGPPFEL